MEFVRVEAAGRSEQSNKIGQQMRIIRTVSLFAFSFSTVVCQFRKKIGKPVKKQVKTSGKWHKVY